MLIFFSILLVLQTIMTIIWGIRGDIWWTLYSLAFMGIDIYYVLKHWPKKPFDTTTKQD